MKKGMIQVSAMYPAGEGLAFNMDYYCNEHMNLVKACVGDALKHEHVVRGIVGAGDVPARYMAVANMYFESIEAFQQSFGPHMDKIMADIPNYTNAVPELQINEVVV